MPKIQFVGEVFDIFDTLFYVDDNERFGDFFVKNVAKLSQFVI